MTTEQLAFDLVPSFTNKEHSTGAYDRDTVDERLAGIKRKMAATQLQRIQEHNQLKRAR